MHFTALIAAASASLLLPAIIASPAPARLSGAGLARRSQLIPREEGGHDLYMPDNDDHEILAEVERVFEVIDHIPDEVLEAGDDETHQWLADNGYSNATLKRDLTDLATRDLEERGFWDVVRCAGALAAFVGTNLVSAAKLLRIKQYIRALGGFRKSARLLLGASTWAERLSEGGQALVMLAGEILGFSLIANNC